MSWNYRICKKTIYNEDTGRTVLYGIHEVYYNEKNEIRAVSVDSMCVMADRFLDEKDESEEFYLNEMKTSVQNMLKAFDKPVIDLDKIEYAKDSE